MPRARLTRSDTETSRSSVHARRESDMNGSHAQPIQGGPLRSIDSSARMMRDRLGLDADAIAVFLIGVDDNRAIALERFEPVRAHRYCQLLMRARHGEAVRIEPSELACPAAEIGRASCRERVYVTV